MNNEFRLVLQVEQVGLDGITLNTYGEMPTCFYWGDDPDYAVILHKRMNLIFESMIIEAIRTDPVQALRASGLNVLVIDEDTDFDELFNEGDS